MQAVYHSQAIQAWEARWFAQGNSADGLMQQVAWGMTQQLQQLLQQQRIQHIALCCGAGNNGGDGYWLAVYLDRLGYNVDIYAIALGASASAQRAQQQAQQQGISIYYDLNFRQDYALYVDAWFGIGLNRVLDQAWQQRIATLNQRRGLKLALDIPSGLNSDTGQPQPCAVRADYTYSALAAKIGLFTGQGKAFSGEVYNIACLPTDAELMPLAQMVASPVVLPSRQAFGHKGSYGHVLMIGGHAQMGGAVMLAAEAAFHAGAGKVSIACDARHHSAILARAPNIMLLDINSLSMEDQQQLIQQVDAISFGMGLGRDAWAEQQYLAWAKQLHKTDKHVVWDADALWFLARYPQPLGANSYATPHPGEAATLLNLNTANIEADRVQHIYALQQRYAGQWVLKGAGSLTLTEQLWLCKNGNPGMATAGMGDVLAGMIASLKAQFHQQICLAQIVDIHACAGDDLATQGERGLQATQMPLAIYQRVNQVS